MPLWSTAHAARLRAVSSSSSLSSELELELERFASSWARFAARANLSAALAKWPSHHFSSHLYRSESSAPRPSWCSRFFTLMASAIPWRFLPRPSPSFHPILLSIAFPYPLYALSFGCVSKLGIFMANWRSARAGKAPAEPRGKGETGGARGARGPGGPSAPARVARRVRRSANRSGTSRSRRRKSGRRLTPACAERVNTRTGG